MCGPTGSSSAKQTAETTTSAAAASAASRRKVQTTTPTTTAPSTKTFAVNSVAAEASASDKRRPVDVVLEPPSLFSRYACASIMIAIFAIWGQVCFFEDEHMAPGVGETQIHSWKVPLVLTTSYLAALPLLRVFSQNYLAKVVDVKLLLKETMVVYNGGQVLLNAWMVYRFIDSLVNQGHPFIGDLYTVKSGTTFAVWIHYMDKYLEFFDTIFMVLRGRMDQVSFLHVYHHISIAWAWWFAMLCYPGGDAYFGALLNSWIHVMMYSYYTLSLLKFSCPWKRYLTQAQLIQFTSVVIYTVFSIVIQLREQVAEPKHYACFAVQIFEMVSLFFLFMHFYSKAYNKKKAAALSDAKNKKRNSSSEADSTEGSVPEQASIASESSDSVDNKKDL